MKEWSRTVYEVIRKPSINVCQALRINSNQITIGNHVLTLTLGCWFFSRGEYIYGLYGLSICLLNGFLDYLDGDIARENKTLSKLGLWLDSGFDVIIQNAVMGAIAIGCYKNGLSVIWIVMFFIANTANNFVSFNYNATFGFDSDKGNELFRNVMDKKPTPINAFLKNLIDPTSSYSALVFFTFRYWIAAGMLLGIMPLCFMFITVLGNFKWAVMYVLYALHIKGEKRLYVLQALAVLDEGRREFYEVRRSC